LRIRQNIRLAKAIATGAREKVAISRQWRKFKSLRGGGGWVGDRGAGVVDGTQWCCRRRLTICLRNSPKGPSGGGISRQDDVAGGGMERPEGCVVATRSSGVGRGDEEHARSA